MYNEQTAIKVQKILNEFLKNSNEYQQNGMSLNLKDEACEYVMETYFNKTAHFDRQIEEVEAILRELFKNI